MTIWTIWESKESLYKTKKSKPDVFSEKVYHRKVKCRLGKKHETMIPWQGGELNTETLTTNPLIHTAGLTTL